MKKLKLKKGLSYSIKGFSCKKESPFSVEDNLAEKLLETGRFEQISTEQEVSKPVNQELSADDIATMKKDELLAYAAAHNIDVEDCKNNEERIERIQGALGLVSFVQMNLEN